MWGLKSMTTILLASSTSKTYSPKSVKDISTDLRELYATLGERAPVYKQGTPTIRFNFVTPPSEDQEWLDKEVFYSDASLIAEGGDLFENVAQKHGNEKPIALYLPGLDGLGISAATWQFNDLSKSFEFWRMSISVDDRTSFGELLNTVCKFISEVSASNKRPVYVVGESFGGLLAPAVALRFQKQSERDGTETPIKGLVLVNPATSFDQSNWDILVPALTSFGFLTDNVPMPFGLPSPYSIVGGLLLSTLIPSSEQIRRILDTILSLESVSNPSGAIDSMQGSFESFRLIAEVLPPELVAHRIKNWMIAGSSLVMPRLGQLEIPTLVVVGTEDNLIDSAQEAKRLTKTLPNCEKLEVKGSGHFVLDDNVNLTEAMLYSKLDPLNFKQTMKPYDSILDWKPPSQDMIDQFYKESVNQLDAAFSPVYISTNDDGKREFGLQNLPRDGPILFVANHQLLGLDLNLLISKCIEIDLPVRGLAHPVIFQQASSRRVDLDGRTPGLQKGGAGATTSDLELFGAVVVTPRNYYRLLQSGQNALLFPGGSREVFHGRDEAYQLFWPKKVDFVRTAARFNATIVPLSAVGMADSFNMLLEPSEVADLPFIGERVREFAANTTAARFDMANNEENFLPPVVAPGLPSRNYFLFGQPISTIDIDPKDKPGCESLYIGLQDTMKQGFKDILVARKKDAYKEAPPRLAYERLTGKKAPTFDIAELNKVKIDA